VTPLAPAGADGRLTRAVGLPLAFPATRLREMRARFGVIAALFLALAPAAHAACPVKVSVDRGAAPLRVTFHAGCVSRHYRWSFGDGKTGRGRVVSHVYGGGRFVPALATDKGTSRAGPVTSVALKVTGPAKADYGQSVVLHATVKPQVPVYLAGRPFRGG